MKNKKLLITQMIWGFLVFFLILNVQGRLIEISADRTQVTLAAGESTTINLTVKNNQNLDDTVKLDKTCTVAENVVLGASELTIPAGGNRTFTATVSIPMGKPTKTYGVIITAVPLRLLGKVSREEDWHYVGIIVKVKGSSKGVSESKDIHLIPQSDLVDYVKEGDISLDLYLNPTLTSSKGDYVLRNGDDVCVGDVLAGDFLPKLPGTPGPPTPGEWRSDGGSCDSPPIVLVDDIDEVIADIESGFYDAETYTAQICWSFGRHKQKCTIDGNLICEYKCEPKFSGGIKLTSDNSLKVTNPGEITIDVKCNLRCIMFVKRTYDWKTELDKYGRFRATTVEDESLLGYMLATPEINLNARYTLNAIENEKMPKIELKKSRINKVGDSYIIRILVMNTGEQLAKIDKIELNLQDYEILSQPKEVETGAVKEIIVKSKNLALIGETLKLTVRYRADRLGCLETKNFEEIFDLGNYKKLKPIVSAQVYRADVKGDCENTYYSCYSPDREGNFYVAYECFNRDPYFTPRNGRVDLKFDISRIAKQLDSGSEILSAKLYLNVNKINKPQQISILSLDNNNWISKDCVPGGDICTQPYCPECLQLYDLNGEVIASKFISNSGIHEFDITDIFKRKVNAKEEYISLQIRGEEDVWNTLGKDSCLNPKDWDKKNIAISGSTATYLQILLSS
ncbi:MAG: hypothetical protein QXY62_01720 [Candidatus Altiarchaeota archaeon]